MTNARVKLCLPLCSPPSYFIIPSFSTPSIRSLVLLPQLYSLGLRVSSLLSDRRARLQLCMSETTLISSYLFFVLHQMLEIPNSIHPFMFFPPIPTSDTLLFLCYCLLIYCLVWLQFFKCLFFSVLRLFGCCLCSAPGCSGERHEGEDAQERREVVVLLARQK